MSQSRPPPRPICYLCPSFSPSLPARAPPPPPTKHARLVHYPGHGSPEQGTQTLKQGAETRVTQPDAQASSVALCGPESRPAVAPATSQFPKKPHHALDVGPWGSLDQRLKKVGTDSPQWVTHPEAQPPCSRPPGLPMSSQHRPPPLSLHGIFSGTDTPNPPSLIHRVSLVQPHSSALCVAHRGVQSHTHTVHQQHTHKLPMIQGITRV